MNSDQAKLRTLIFRLAKAVGCFVSEDALHLSLKQFLHSNSAAEYVHLER